MVKIIFSSKNVNFWNVTVWCSINRVIVAQNPLYIIPKKGCKSRNSVKIETKNDFFSSCIHVLCYVGLGKCSLECGTVRLPKCLNKYLKVWAIHFTLHLPTKAVVLKGSGKCQKCWLMRNNSFFNCSNHWKICCVFSRNGNTGIVEETKEMLLKKPILPE